MLKLSLLLLLAAAPLLLSEIAHAAKPTGVKTKADRLKGCMKGFSENVNEAVVKRKDGNANGRGRVKMAKGSKFTARKKAMRDFYGKTKEEVKYETANRQCTAQVFDNAAANREFSSLNSIEACKRDACGTDESKWDDPSCYKPATDNSPSNGKAAPCIDELEAVFAADTPCIEGDCRPECVNAIMSATGQSATYNVSDTGNYVEVATARRLSERSYHRRLLEDALRGAHDGRAVDLSGLPQVLHPVYHHLRAQGQQHRQLLADDVDEDDDYDDEQENGVSWENPRMGEIMDRIANKLDSKTVERFCKDLDDDGVRTGVVNTRISNMDRKENAQNRRRELQEMADSSPTLQRRRNLQAIRRLVEDEDFKLRTSCTNDDTHEAVDKRTDSDSESLFCCEITGGVRDSSNVSVPLTCTIDGTSSVGVSLSVAPPTVVAQFDSATNTTTNVTIYDSPSCICYQATLAAPELLYELGARDLEVDCVSRGDGLCTSAVYAYDVPYDVDEDTGEPLYSNYLELLTRLATQVGVDGADFRFKMIPDNTTDPDKWYRRKVSYMDKYEIMKRLKVAQYVSNAIKIGCAVAQSVSAVTVGGFAFVAGARIKPADIVCPVLIAIPDSLVNYWASVVADIDNQNSVIDGTETTAMYQMLHVLGYNQEVALDVAITATKAAGAKVSGAMSAETDKIIAAIEEAQEDVEDVIIEENERTRLEITKKINDTKNEILAELDALNITIKVSQDKVDGLVCDAKTKASLSQREVDYQRRLLLVPQGRMPGYVNSVNAPNTTLAWKDCNSPTGASGNSPPSLNQCSQLGMTTIATTEDSWACRRIP